MSRVGLEPGLDLVSLPPGGGPQLGLEAAHVAGDVGQPLPGQPPQAVLYQGQAPVRGLVSGAFRLGISVIFLEFWALNFSIIFTLSENYDNNTLSQNLILLPRFRKQPLVVFVHGVSGSLASDVLLSEAVVLTLEAPHHGKSSWLDLGQVSCDPSWSNGLLLSTILFMYMNMF